MASPTPSVPATNEKQPPKQSGSTYISGGRLLEAPPLGARINTAITNLYNIGGLYVTSLFSLDPYDAAQNSRFNTTRSGQVNARPAGRALGSGGSGSGNGNGGGSGGGSSRWFGWGSGGGNGGSGSGGGRSGGRRFGTVDDVRGPECGSCQ